MTADDADPPQADDRTIELERLRNQVVAQAREHRWELSSLMRQHPVSGRVTQAKYSILRRFPKHANRVRQVRRAAQGLIASLRRRTANDSRPSGIVNFGPSLLLRAPMLLIGDSPIARQLAEITPAGNFVWVEQGAGFTRSLPVPQANEPPLRTPAEGSFVKWLIDDARRLRKFGAIVVDAADDLSLGLLRGRLGQTQTLVLIAATGASMVSPLVAELGEPAAREAGM
jgi:hypothetical protein